MSPISAAEAAKRFASSLEIPCRRHVAEAIVMVEPVGIEPTTSSLQS